MPGADILDIYERVFDIASDMLAAAREGDWDRLIALEKRCSGQVDRLRTLDRNEPLGEAQRQRKIELIHQLLERDREIRRIVTPWMDELARLINAGQMRGKLASQYVCESDPAQS